MPIRNQSDIAAVEAVPLSERALPESSYAALVDASKRSPDAQALSFFLSADRLDEAHDWTYAELVADVTRAANLLAALGVAADRPVAYVLPNLPETHFAVWGGEAAGAALAVNPMLEPRQVADIMRFARASILVTLAPALNPKAWTGLAEELASLPDLSAIAFVDMADYLDGEKRGAARASIEEAAARSQLKVVNLREAMREQPSDQLVPPRTIKADDISSYFCTGGTTGAPKIAVRTHRNEVFDVIASETPDATCPFMPSSGGACLAISVQMPAPKSPPCPASRSSCCPSPISAAIPSRSILSTASPRA